MNQADARLTAFARQARYVPLSAGETVLCFSNMEITVTVVVRAGRFEMEKRDRGSAPRVMMASESIAVVRRYLIRFLGSDVRAHLRLPHLMSPVGALPPGFRLDEGESGVWLRWTEGDIEESAWFAGSYAARELRDYALAARTGSVM